MPPHTVKWRKRGNCMPVLTHLENIFDIVVRYGILLLNAVGVAILLYTSVRCLIDLGKRNEQARIRLAEGTALALSFKLGAEVLRTVTVREWSELVMLGAVIALRAALSFLIRWELKNERKNLAAEARDGGEPDAAFVSDAEGA